MRKTAAGMVLDELCNLILSMPSLHEIIDFRVSEELHGRLLELRHASNEGMLTQEQAAEFDAYLRLAEVINTLKIKARKKLMSST